MAEIVGWNAQHPAWVAAHATLGNCTRAIALAAPMLGPVVPALVVPVGVPAAIAQPYPAFHGTSYLVPAPAIDGSIGQDAPGLAGLAPAVAAGPFVAGGAYAAGRPAPGALPGEAPDASAAGMRPFGETPVAPGAPGRPLPRIPLVPSDETANLQIPSAPTIVSDAPQPQPVPEPSTLALLGGLCLVLGILRSWGYR